MDVLKKFQSPMNDENYNNWCKEINNKLKNNIYYKDFIPYFFRELFNRIIDILEQIQKFKENIII